MRTQIPLRAMLRQPVKLTIFIVLIALSSFAFVTKSVEGLIVNGEISRLSGLYTSVGKLMPTGDNLSTKDSLVTACDELISQSEYVKYTNNKRLISGIMEDIYTPDIDGWSPYPNKMFIYGTLISKGEGYSSTYNVNIYWFDIFIDTVDASLPDYVETGATKRFYLEDYNESLRYVYDESIVGERYYLKGQCGCIVSFAYSIEPVTELEASSYLHLLLVPLTDNGIYLYSVQKDEVVHNLVVDDEIEALKENIHTIFLRTTKDMTALPEAEESLFIVDGRLIDYEDNKNVNRACVIRKEFAELRGLSVGDTITITMRNLEFAVEYTPPSTLTPDVYSFMYYGRYGNYNSYGSNKIGNLEMATGYITDSDQDKNWRNAKTRIETFEIVGIYGTTENSDRIYTVSQNNVYIPDSCIPASWMQEPFYTTYSIVLNSPDDETAFMKEYLSQLDEIGYWLTFIENGWNAFTATVSPIRSSIKIGIIIFSLLIPISYYLIVFLYYSGRKREYAILRALGTASRAALRKTAFPILLAGVLGIVAGSVSAWFYATNRSRITLNVISDAEYTDLSLLWLLLIKILLFGLLLLFTLIETHMLSKLSLLELLQGKRGIRKKDKHATFSEQSMRSIPVFKPVINVNKAPSLGNSSSAKSKEIKNGINIAYIVRNVIKRIVRVPGKSVLVVIIAAGFMVVLCFMKSAIIENDERLDYLYNNTIVTGTIISDSADLLSGLPSGIISSATLNQILKTGYIADYYAEALQSMSLISLNPSSSNLRSGYLCEAKVLGINNLNKYKPFVNSEIIIEYAEGYGQDLFEKDDFTEYEAILSRSLMLMLGAELGDHISICSQNQYYVMYKVVGCFDNLSTDPGINVIVPLVDIQKHAKSSVRYTHTEFNLDTAKNRNLVPFREEIKEIFSQIMAPKLIFILRDHTLREKVDPLERNVELIKMLYLIVVIVAVLISIGLSLLLVIQAAKDVAIMRVLGTTKRKVSIILLCEQSFLCVLGLALGAMSMFIFGNANLTAAALYLMGCVVSTYVCVLIVTNKRSLELLQVKE